MNQPIRAKVTLQNVTVHNIERPGMAGKAAVIGVFPSTNKDVKTFENITDLRNFYNIVPKSKRETEFKGAKCAKYLFQDGIKQNRGVTTLTTVNIYNGTSTDLAKYNSINENNTSGSTTTTTPSTGNSGEGTVTEGQTTEGDVDTVTTNTDLNVSFADIELALKKIAHEQINIINFACDFTQLTDVKNNTYSLIEVWDKIISLVDSGFTNQKPSYIIGGITTPGQGSATLTYSGNTGVGCESVDIYGSEGDGYTIGSNGVKTYTKNSTFKPGVRHITKAFTTGRNELTTAGLYAIGGSVNGEAVDAIELGAFMAGWIAGLNIGVDLTNKVIPGLTGIDEELVFGENDAGYVLTNMGIQVIEPMDRLQGTFRVQNSVTPLGWHTNHVRSVAYLLNQFGLESGLGINNLESEIQAFKAALKTTAADVMEITDAISDVKFGEINTISAWEVEVPIDIELNGVVTEIHADINMSLRDYSNTTVVSEYVDAYNV